MLFSLTKMTDIISNYSAAIDIFAFIADRQAQHDAVALVVITGTRGGGIRPQGALMAITASGRVAGSVSNGCLDSDVVLNAQKALKTGKACTLCYGEGSPFLDIRLPCGGSLDLIIIPHPDMAVIHAALNRLNERRPVAITLNEGEIHLATENTENTAGWQGQKFFMICEPRIRMRIAGRGPEVVALTRLALAADMQVHIQSPDAECLRQAEALGASTETLKSISALPDTAKNEGRDDPWTACILMFHDHDWELNLLRNALSGDAFYIGALGSRNTHAARSKALADGGVSPKDIKRVHGPIGLIPAARDSSMLAISTLAEIAQVFDQRKRT